MIWLALLSSTAGNCYFLIVVYVFMDINKLLNIIHKFLYNKVLKMKGERIKFIKFFYN